MSLQPRGEPPRRNWLDEGWGAECVGGDGARLWMREFDGNELAGPAPFDFVGRGRERCRLGARGHLLEREETCPVVEAHEDMHGLSEETRLRATV